VPLWPYKVEGDDDLDSDL